MLVGTFEDLASKAVSAELDLRDALERGDLRQPQSKAVSDIGILDEGG